MEPDGGGSVQSLEQGKEFVDLIEGKGILGHDFQVMPQLLANGLSISTMRLSSMTAKVAKRSLGLTLPGVLSPEGWLDVATGSSISAR